MPKTVEGALRFFNFHCCKVSKNVYRKCKKGPCASKPKKAIVYVCMAQVIEGACRKGEGGVDTLQAAELPCSVSNCPVKKIENLGRQSK